MDITITYFTLVGVIGSFVCCLPRCLDGRTTRNHYNDRGNRRNRRNRRNSNMFLTRDLSVELEEIIIDYSPYLIEVDNKDDSCSICLCSKNKGDIRMIRCTHSYHYNCINEWLNVKQICPDCRTSIK